MKGFTLTEILLASFIMTLVVGGTLAIYFMAQDNWSEGNIRDSLQRNASLAMEIMISGFAAQGEAKGYGIREGRDPVIVSSSEIQVTVDKNSTPTPNDEMDDTTISYYLDGDGNLIYDPDVNNAEDERTIIEAQDGLVIELSFAEAAGLVEIELALQRPFRSRNVSVDLFTRVRPRN